MGAPSVVYRVWMCDCDYRRLDGDPVDYSPPFVVGLICQARENDEGSIIVNIVQNVNYAQATRNESGDVDNG